jgi:hypothetical protein
LDGVPRPTSTERILAETAAQHVILRDGHQQVGTTLFLYRPFKLPVAFIQKLSAGDLHTFLSCCVTCMIKKQSPGIRKHTLLYRQYLAVPFAVNNGIA